MTDTTSLFLSAELIEMGLMAAADPHFAARLLEALRRLSAEHGNETASGRETTSGCPEELCA